MTDDVAIDVLVKEFPGRTIQVQTELWFYPNNKEQPQRVRRFWLSVLPGLDGDKCDGWRGESVAECVQKAMAARDAVRLTPKCDSCGQTIKEFSAAQAGIDKGHLNLRLPIEALTEGQPCPVCNRPLSGAETVHDDCAGRANRAAHEIFNPQFHVTKEDRLALDPGTLARAEREPLL